MKKAGMMTAGMLVGATLTLVALVALAPAGAQRDGVAPLDILAGTAYVETGAGATSGPVYVFFDPACIWCGELFAAFDQAPEPPRVRWIPVASLGVDSGVSAAALLTAEAPAEALYRHFAGLEVSYESAPDNMVQQIENQTKLLKQLPGKGVPAVVFRDKAGRTQVIRGYLPPEQFLSQVGRGS